MKIFDVKMYKSFKNEFLNLKKSGKNSDLFIKRITNQWLQLTLSIVVQIPIQN